MVSNGESIVLTLLEYSVDLLTRFCCQEHECHDFADNVHLLVTFVSLIFERTESVLDETINNSVRYPLKRSELYVMRNMPPEDRFVPY